ncbi:MAG: hypothetical protein AABX61_00125 [Nanoarchaeota archaeon]
MHKLEDLVDSNKKSFNKFYYKSRHLAYCLIIPMIMISFNGCKKDEDVVGVKENTLEVERSKIVNTYFSWSNKLIAQDYAGALSYCVPGSNGEGRTQVHKSHWDRGEQSYDDITHVEAWLDEEDLSRNYGEAVGNTTYYQYSRTAGSVEYKLGFYSSVRKIDGKWKIDGINSNNDPDWWK